MPTPKYNILIIDDDCDDFYLISTALKKCDRSHYNPHWSQTFEDALEQLATKEFSVCLVDFRLGAQTGDELIRKVISIGYSVPMILLTGANDTNIDLLAMEAGAVDYLEKDTFSSALLDRAIRYAIERRRIEEELVRAAQCDSLTGLANRSYFKSRLSEALDRADRGKRDLAVLFVDLDGFKPINDALGHHVGDQVLVDAASRLKDCIRSFDTVGRMGGDEFVLILEEFNDQNDVALVAQRTLQKLKEPFFIDSRQVELSASIGIAMFPRDSRNSETLLRHADAAMYRAKEGGKASYQFFNSTIQARTTERALLRADATKAMTNGAFRLHYQPQAQVSTNTIVGVEALLRWQRDGKLISPFHFIPVLEQTGLIIPVGEWVIEQACNDLRDWYNMGTNYLRMAINISPRQLANGPRLIDYIFGALDRTGIAPQNLELEITENLAMQDPEQSQNILRQLKAGGVRLSIDDFGVGHSNLDYLRRYPFDSIKVDRGFIMGIPDTDNGTLAAAIIGLGARVGLEVVAEGIETAEQLDFVHKLGCDHYQGYLLSRPIPASDCAELFNTRIAA